MRRFTFSRSRNRSTSSSEQIRDIYDPDQRPITISSSQKIRNKTTIVKPRIYTSNFITNRSSLSSNYDETNLNNAGPLSYNVLNINEVDDEYNISELNYDQFSQKSSSYSKNFVSVPLPSYIDEEKLGFNEERGNRDCSFYSPPEIKSPSASKFNVISRFIHTSQQIDRLGQSYSSQTNRSARFNKSQITTIDTYKEIAKKAFKQNPNDQNKDTDTKEFLAQYLLDHTKHENAKIIQKAFRLSRNRSHFKRFIRINMTINYNLKKLTFSLWRLTVVNRTDQLISIFRKIKELYQFIDRHFKIREISPFRLFYVTQQLFIPKGYTAELIYKFFYLMHFNVMSRVFYIWLRFAKKHIQHRKTLLRTRFSGKKFSNFGFIYHIFINWHRLTVWRLQARANPKKKYIILKDLNEHEANVFWSVREHTLNVKRSRIKRATEFSIKRIAAKAVRALYNRSIEASSEKTIIETADRFRNKHLQTLSHRAWLKFMQKRLQELQVLRDTMHAWYSHVYVDALNKTKFELAEKLFLESFITRIMNAWFRQARERRIRRTAMSLRIHKKPSSMFFVIFALQGDFDLAFQVLCFRMWIRVTRTRKRWHLFVRWCMLANLDGSSENQSVSSVAEKERKMIVLSDLRRAAHLKIIKRGTSSLTNFLPRHTWKSVELSYAALRQIKFILSHRTIDFNSSNFKNSKFFKDENETKTWRFLTEEEPNKKKDDSSLDFSAQTLVRCFLLKLQQQKHYEMTKIKDEFQTENSLDGQQSKLRTLDELEDQCKRNISLLRKHNIEKVRRDHATLASMLSHISAQKTQDSIPDFSTTLYSFDKIELPIETKYTKSDNYDSLRTSSMLEIGAIFVYPEVDESIENLVKENNLAENKLPSTFEATKQKAMINFQKRLRNPSCLQGGNLMNMMSESEDMYGENTTISLSQMGSDNDSNSSFGMSLSQTSLLSSNFGSTFSLLNPASTVTSPMKFANSPIKNPLISNYVKPSAKNDPDNLMMNLFETTSARATSSSSFTIANFKRVLEKFPTDEDIVQSFVIFFMNVCKVQLDVSEMKSISKMEDLLPKPQVSLSKKKSSMKIKKTKSKKEENAKNANTSQSELNFKNEEDEAEIILQTHRHMMMKNMNLFIAELNGYSSEMKRIPLKLRFPQSVENCLNAIFTIFNALKKVPSLAQYLDLTPFSTRIKTTDQLVISTQDKTWTTLKNIFPKIELPTESSSIMSMGNKMRRRSNFASSLFAIGSIQNFDEVLGSNDAFLACYLLPYIMSFELVNDFIKEEMKSNRQ